MADDLDKKLKQIADMFGVSDTSGLKNIVESIVPPNSNVNVNTSQAPGSNPVVDQNPSYSGNANYSSPPVSSNRSIPDMGLLSKVSEMLGAFNNVSDSRITLLNSVQPFLGSQRQQRLTGAVQLLKVIAVLNTLSPNFNRNNNTKG